MLQRTMIMAHGAPTCQVRVTSRADAREARQVHTGMRGAIVNSQRTRFLANARHGTRPMMIVLLLFLQKQNLAFAVYLLGSVLSLPD